MNIILTLGLRLLFGGSYFLTLLTVLTLCTLLNRVSAEEFPARPVRWIIGFPPGGSSDLQGRLFADKLSKIWGQPVVVENISGAGSGVAASTVARAKADGYTIFFVTHPVLAVNPFIYEKLSYDPEKDFLPVIKLSDSHNVLLVNASSPYRQVSDLIRAAKDKPGSLNFGSGGLGTTQHLTAESFKAAAGIQLTHIPYRGTGPAATALLVNEIQLHFDGTFSAMAQMSGGRVRGLAISSLQRLPTLPDLPTLNESGLPGFEATLAYGLLVPVNTPVAIVNQINRDTLKVLQDAVLKKQLQDQGIYLLGSTPEQFKVFLTNERKKWGELLKRLNIRAS